MGIVTNIILDPIMIFTFNWGIAGAAIATALAEVVGFTVMCYAAWKSKKRPFEKLTLRFKIEIDHMKQIFRWSIPICLENLLFTTMAMITMRFVAAFGAPAMAVSKVGAQEESLSWLIGGGYSSALTAFVGQNYGGRKWSRLRSCFRSSVILMLIYGALVTALLFFGAAFLIGIFLPEAHTILLGADYLRIMAICQIPTCMEAVANGCFRGIGNTKPPSLISIVANVSRVILAYFLGRSFLGLNGIWWALTIATSLRGLWMLAWYIRSMRRHPQTDAR